MFKVKLRGHLNSSKLWPITIWRSCYSLWPGSVPGLFVLKHQLSLCGKNQVFLIRWLEIAPGLLISHRFRTSFQDMSLKHLMFFSWARKVTKTFGFWWLFLWLSFHLLFSQSPINPLSFDCWLLSTLICFLSSFYCAWHKLLILGHVTWTSSALSALVLISVVALCK